MNLVHSFKKTNKLKNNKKEGYWEELSKDEHLTKVNYVNGNPDGVVKTFYPNGQLKCVFYAIYGKNENKAIYNLPLDICFVYFIKLK